MKDAFYWIDGLGLSEHPEGGYFRRSYRAEEGVEAQALPERFAGYRPFSTAIYYLLRGEQFSALHRIKSDELWHFYAGSSLTLYSIDGVGRLETKKLGREIGRGESLQLAVRAGLWFGATVDDPGSYALVGCTVAPGFDFEDFVLGDRRELIRQYPQHRSLIERLTR